MNYHDPNTQSPRLPDARRQAARAQLEQFAASAAKGRRWTRRGTVVSAASAVVLCTGAAAVAYSAYQPVTNTSSARCYTSASLGAGNYTTIASPGKNGPARAENALGVCASLWQQGFLRPGAKGIDRFGSSRTHDRVPGLVVCTMSDGTAAVFPGKPSTCGALGLPQATPARG